MKVDISVDVGDQGDIAMFMELLARVPALRSAMRRTNYGYALEVRDDHARYLTALMVERLTGAETYEQWLAKNTDIEPKAGMIQACFAAPFPPSRSLGER